MSKTTPKTNSHQQPSSFTCQHIYTEGWVVTQANHGPSALPPAPGKELDVAAGLFSADFQETGPHALQSSSNSHLSLSKYTEQP